MNEKCRNMTLVRMKQFIKKLDPKTTKLQLKLNRYQLLVLKYLPCIYNIYNTESSCIGN